MLISSVGTENADAQTPEASAAALQKPAVPGEECIGENQQLDDQVMTIRFGNEEADGFACPHCALRGVDGNTLARHLIEDCGAQCATLHPDPAIVVARQQAEEQLRLQQEHQVSCCCKVLLMPQIKFFILMIGPLVG